VVAALAVIKAPRVADDGVPSQPLPEAAPQAAAPAAAAPAAAAATEEAVHG
jgi:hypothetical protein